MVKKDTDEEIEEQDFEEDDEDDNEDDEESEEPVRKKKGKLKSKDWIVQHFPEAWTVFDPLTKQVIASAPTSEMLGLELQRIAAQKASESAKQTE